MSGTLSVKLLSDDSLMVLSGIKQHLIMINCGCANIYTIHISQSHSDIKLYVILVTRLYVILVTRLYVIVVTRLQFFYDIKLILILIHIT